MESSTSENYAESKFGPPLERLVSGLGAFVVLVEFTARAQDHTLKILQRMEQYIMSNTEDLKSAVDEIVAEDSVVIQTLSGLNAQAAQSEDGSVPAADVQAAIATIHGEVARVRDAVATATAEPSDTAAPASDGSSGTSDTTGTDTGPSDATGSSSTDGSSTDAGSQTTGDTSTGGTDTSTGSDTAAPAGSTNPDGSPVEPASGAEVGNESTATPDTSLANGGTGVFDQDAETSTPDTGASTTSEPSADEQAGI